MHRVSPLVSVIVPTRNRAALLRGCVESLVEQTFPAELFEVVVVDDASTDGTAHVVADLISARRTPRIRYLPLPRIGGNGARNAGVKNAAAGIVCFVDDDEVVQPTHVRSVIEHLEREPSLDGVGGPSQRHHRPGSRSCPRCEADRPIFPGTGRRKVEWLLGGNMALRKAVFERRGLFHEGLPSFQEYEWFRRGPVLELLYDPDLWVWHRLDERTLLERCRSAWRQGTAIPLARAKLGFGESTSWRQLFRYMGHATIRLCGHGLVLACRQAGALIGARATVPLDLEVWSEGCRPRDSQVVRPGRRDG